MTRVRGMQRPGAEGQPPGKAERIGWRGIAGIRLGLIARIGAEDRLDMARMIREDNPATSRGLTAIVWERGGAVRRGVPVPERSAAARR
jgi:hypothetical protein